MRINEQVSEVLMAVRKARKAKAIKAKSKKAMPRKAAKKRKTAAPRKKKVAAKSAAINHKAQWNIYKELEKQIDKAWAKLRADVKRKANPQILVKDKNHLMLLLGECNYMVRECVRHIGRRK
jgi:hypothetical protein